MEHEIHVLEMHRCTFNYGSEIHSLTALIRRRLKTSPVQNTTNKISTGQEKDLECEARVRGFNDGEHAKLQLDPFEAKPRVKLYFEDAQEVQALTSTEQGIAPCLGLSSRTSAQNLRGFTVASFGGLALLEKYSNVFWRTRALGK